MRPSAIGEDDTGPKDRGHGPPFRHPRRRNNAQCRVDLSVRLTTLDGDLSFTGLETWQPGLAPGAPGTGTAFGIASLNYEIAIKGNAFAQTGGDAGTIDGRFFDRSHQGMGGTIRREDFAGAFAGKR